MKLGCCINMLADENETIGMKYIPDLKRAGYDYVEIPLAQSMELSPRDYNKLKHKLEEENLPCECCNNFFPSYIRLTGKEVDWDKIKSYTEKSMEKAADLGAKILVFGSSGAKNVPFGFSKELALQQIAKVLELVDLYAQQYKIQVAIEPLNRQESNIILNLSEGQKLAKMKLYKNIKLLVDFYHYRKEKETEVALRNVVDSIIHVHFAEPKERCFPTENKEEYSQFFHLLKKEGYNGRVSIEAYSKNPEEDIRKGTAIRRYWIRQDNREKIK